MNDEQHRDMRIALGAFALDQLGPEERTAVQAHLDGCASCRTELAQLAPLRGHLDLVDVDRLDEVPVTPAELGPRIIDQLRREAPARAATLDAGRRPSSRRRARRRRSALAVTVVGAAAAAVLAFGAGWMLRPDPPAGPLEAVAVRALDTEVREVTADVVPHTWGMEIKLQGSGFRAGDIYDVSVITASGEPVGAGAFIGVGATSMDCNLNSSVLREDATGFEVVDSSGRVVLTSTF